MHQRTRLPSVLTHALTTLMLMPAARAADTIEIWDAGAFEVELQLGHSGTGRPADQRSMGGQLLLGHGTGGAVSVYALLSLDADESLAGGTVWPALGLMGTPLDTDHLDLDLLLEVGTAANRPGELELWAGFELNLDHRPDLASRGLYLRAGLPMGFTLGPESHSAAPELRLDGTLGAYLTVAGGHQLLAEASALFLLHAPEGPAAPEEASFAVGYNLQITETLEWVTQLGLAMAAEHAWRPGLDLQTGFLLALPVH